MDFTIYWPDIKDFSNFTSHFIQAVIAHGEACQVAFEVRRGEMVCYVNGKYTSEYQAWSVDQNKAYQKVSGE